MKNLVLIPLSFPYEIGGEFSFLNDEVKYYKGNFEHVIILPCLTSPIKTKIDEDIFVDHSLNIFKDKPFFKLMRFVFKKPKLLLTELLINQLHFNFIERNKKAIKEYFLIVKYLAFFNKYFSEKKGEWIIYTYWYTPITIAAALYAKENNNIKVITRAHGIDLYEERNNNYFPFRKKTITSIDLIVLISDHGKNYLRSKYKIEDLKIMTFGLGNIDFKTSSKKSNKGQLSIVSCSTIDTNKRVELIFESIIKISLIHPEVNFIWCHFGTGPLFEDINKKIKLIQNKNVSLNLFGKVGNDIIINYYKTKCVDVFITTSASEGRPYSIMEALCFAIPIIATSVGGIPELVTKENGILLNANPNISEVTSALGFFISNQNELYAKSLASRKKWEEKCNAEKVFPQFIDHIKAI